VSHIGYLIPGFWGAVLAWFTYVGWSVSKPGSLICAYGAAVSFYVVAEGLTR